MSLFAPTKTVTVTDLISEAAKKSTDAEDVAKVDLGFVLEEIQDKWADMAKSKTTYPDYLKQKKTLLAHFRDLVVKVYSQTYTLMRLIGYPEKEAEKAAKQSAEAYKAPLMLIFDSIFAKHGKIEKVY